MAATITATAKNGAKHTFEVLYIGLGQWGINHPGTGQAAGRAHNTIDGWSAFVQDSTDPAVDTDTLHETHLKDEFAAVYAVAHEYANRYLTAPRTELAAA